MQDRAECYRLQYEYLVEICHAIELRDRALLNTLLAQERYIECLDWDADRFEIFYWNRDFYTALFDSTDVHFCDIPLEKAVATQDIEIVELILETGRYLPNWCTCLAAGLEAAIALKSMEMASLLLLYGADPSKAFSEDAPLIHAVLGNDFELVNLLLAKGAFVDPESSDNMTPLLFASMYGHLEIVKLLINAGANANHIPTNPPHGALSCAVLSGHTEVYEYLLMFVSNQEEISFAKEKIRHLEDSIFLEETWIENEE
jgi:hypothetical protein